MKFVILHISFNICWSLLESHYIALFTLKQSSSRYLALCRPSKSRNDIFSVHVDRQSRLLKAIFCPCMWTENSAHACHLSVHFYFMLAYSQFTLAHPSTSSSVRITDHSPSSMLPLVSGTNSRGFPPSTTH